MQRKLAVILSADVVGFTGLLEADEEGTLRQLKANRAEVFDPLVQSHGGRQFKLMGDGALVEFSSAVAAVQCALAIQTATEDEPAAAGRIRYRIGVNLGEVVVDGEDIYGDGVNVAVRIQALAPAGGVTLTKAVHDNVLGKVACAFDDLDEQELKNISRPVHVFAVGAADKEGAPAGEPEAPRRLSICVLPFANISGEAEQEYFSDGISEDILTDLSKVPALFVVARNTAFQFKGKNVDLQQLARQLKVTHVLEGSVRKSAGRVRISARLVDGATGGHVWVERFDRDLNDIFALQDEVSEAIVRALELKLLPGEPKAVERRGTDNVEAYNIFLMARQYYAAGNEGDVRREAAIVRMCRRATELDPGYGRAWALMALAKNLMPDGTEGKEDGGLADAERALALDANLAEAHAVKARILFDAGHTDQAQAEIEHALRLEPDSYEANRTAGNLCLRQRRLHDAIPYLERAVALVDAEFNCAAVLVSCYRAAGDLAAARRMAQTALARAEKTLERDHDNGAAMDCAVTALAELGEMERANEWIRRALLINPENMNMRYNFACVLSLHGQYEAALDMLAPVLALGSKRRIAFARLDHDLDPLRSDPRFEAMMAAAEQRVGRSDEKPTTQA